MMEAGRFPGYFDGIIAGASGLDQFCYLVFQDTLWSIGQLNFTTDIVLPEDTAGG